MKEYLGLNAPFIGLPPPPNNSAPELIQFYLKSVNKCTGTVLVEDVVANTLAHGFLKGFNPAQTYDMPIVVMAAITSIEKSVIENNGHTIPSISSATYQTATNEQVAREPNSFQPDIGANLATNANGKQSICHLSFLLMTLYS